MANLSPFGPQPQYEDTAGAPAVGYRLFFYVNNSVGTKQNTYTTAAGVTPNTNPIVLNALGEPTGNVGIFFPSGTAYTIVFAPPGTDDPPNSPIWTRNDVYGINDVTSTQDQWVAFTGAPTYVGATSFTLVGDQTSTFHIGRRLKTTNSGGTVYSTISNSVFGAVTTVTVLNDGAGVLDAGLSAVSYGLVSYVNPSILGGWVSFPAIQKPSSDVNTLDDYEEGTFTPTLTFAVVGDLNVVYATRSGIYTKIGRVVTAHVVIQTSTFTFTTASGSCIISGLPFTASTTCIGAVNWQGITKANYTQMVCQTTGTTLLFAMSGSAQASAQLAAADMPTGGTVIFQTTVSYIV